MLYNHSSLDIKIKSEPVSLDNEALSVGDICSVAACLADCVFDDVISAFFLHAAFYFSIHVCR